MNAKGVRSSASPASRLERGEGDQEKGKEFSGTNHRESVDELQMVLESSFPRLLFNCASSSFSWNVSFP